MGKSKAKCKKAKDALTKAREGPAEMRIQLDVILDKSIMKSESERTPMRHTKA